MRIRPGRPLSPVLSPVAKIKPISVNVRARLKAKPLRYVIHVDSGGASVISVNEHVRRWRETLMRRNSTTL